MTRSIATFTIMLFAATLSLGSPSARRALIIGNNKYALSPLKNADSDAAAVTAVLRSLGYSTVFQYDANHQAMEQAITTFTNGINPGDTVLFYYSGHGLQVDGENYLVPTDFTAGSPLDVRYQAFSLSQVLDKFSSHGASTSVIILDACRDNPFAAVRSLRGGWASQATSAGTFLAFATAPGATASDNPTEEHGLFTKALLEYISSPLDIEQIFEKVREQVVLQSDGLQVPWIASSLIGSFHLNPTLDTTVLPNSNLATMLVGDSAQTVAAARSASIQTEASPNGAVSARILTSQALLLAQHKDYDRALHSLTAALSADPTFSLAFRVIGLIFHLLGRSTDAVRELNQALLVDPTDYLAYYYRCLAQVSSDPASAVRDCEASIGLRSDFAGAHLGMSAALLALGQTDKSYSEANESIRLNRQAPLGYALRGRISAVAGRSSESTRDYQNAVKLTSPDRTQ